MLPKEEKIKKTPDDKQPGLFDKEDERKRLVKKRKFIYIAMALTVGLSLSFWAYRSIKNFKMPSFNTSVSSPKTTSIKTTSDFSLPKNSSTWSIFLKRIDINSIVYQHNQKNIDPNSILAKINQTNLITSSAYTNSLPQGLKIKEIVEEKDNSFSYFSTITTPAQQLLLIIKITDSKNLTEAKKSVPDLINQLYWYSLQK